MTLVLVIQQVLYSGEAWFGRFKRAQPLTSDLWDLDLSHQLAEHLHDSRVRKFASYASEISHCKAIICLSDLLGLRWALCSYHARHKQRLAVSLERKNLHKRNIIHLPITFQLSSSVTTCSSLCAWLYQVLDGYHVRPVCLLTLQTLGNPVP